MKAGFRRSVIATINCCSKFTLPNKHTQKHAKYLSNIIHTELRGKSRLNPLSGNRLSAVCLNSCRFINNETRRIADFSSPIVPLKYPIKGIYFFLQTGYCTPSYSTGISLLVKVYVF